MSSKNLIFVVEGDTELSFVHQHIIPYLYRFPESSGWHMHAQKVTTNRQLNTKGGVMSYQLFKNEIVRMSHRRATWITTMIDYFMIPKEFPGYDAGIDAMERAIKEDIGYPCLVPYIQRHEFEALLFADVEPFRNIGITEKQYSCIQEIGRKFANVEDINGGEKTAPSKRLKGIFHYDKKQDASILLQDVPLETMMQRAPRFAEWTRSLVDILGQ